MILGIDTSNYRTSAALYDPKSGFYKSCGRLLTVPEGSLGLRQSDALFQHVKQLPDIIDELFCDVDASVTAISCSDRPRAIENSYMPCFLAGHNFGKSMATAVKVPFYAFSHQQGHIASAAFSVGKLDILKGDFLAWHLSGGTTELLYVSPSEDNIIKAEIIGGTSDISAGQLIDRAGVAFNMPFPAGPYVEQSALKAVKIDSFTVKQNEGYFSLSGMENKFRAKIADGCEQSEVCAFVLASVTRAVCDATKWARQKYGNLPVLFSGGVSACSIIRDAMNSENVFFATKQFCGDNGLGAAVLAAFSDE